MNWLHQAFEVAGALGMLCTALALFFPKGSTIGAALAKVGSDLKGHTTQSNIWFESPNGTKVLMPVSKKISPKELDEIRKKFGVHNVHSGKESE